MRETVSVEAVERLPVAELVRDERAALVLAPAQTEECGALVTLRTALVLLVLVVALVAELVVRAVVWSVEEHRPVARATVVNLGAPEWKSRAIDAAVVSVADAAEICDGVTQWNAEAILATFVARRVVDRQTNSACIE